MSTSPVLIALFGMPSDPAVDGSCAMHIPPLAFMAFNPMEPSVPKPDSIIPTLLSF